SVSCISLCCLLYIVLLLVLYLFLVFVLYFFFYLSGHHRALHSFPTRRSSDLSIASITGFGMSAAPALLRWLRCAQPGVSARQRRSEEHTSELQSRVDLVCRLLLEKKKKMA